MCFTEKATKYCEADGQWFRPPESNKIWTNYTLCVTTDDKRLGVMSVNRYSNEFVANLKLLYCFYLLVLSLVYFHFS